MIAVESGMKGVSLDLARAFVPGNHIHDHQMRLFMKLKISKTLPAAAAQAGISVATASRFGHDPRLPSAKKARRASRRRDPLVDIFEAEVASPPRRTSEF